MGFLNDIIGAATHGGDAPAIHPALLEHILGTVNGGQGGGLGDIISKLNAGGLGSAVSSWAGSGANQAVSGEQIQAALGNEHIQELAQKFGLPPSAVAGHLAQILPMVISHLAPGGNVAAPDSMESAIGLLKGKLFG
jgi:uncharacterized protein YidB (DUF937 family)